MLDEKNSSNSRALSRIQELELKELFVPWNEICHLARRFSVLNNLDASSNALKTLCVPLVTPHLRSLTLEYNEFECLSDLSELTSLSTLETLKLKGNNISTITKDSRPHPVFGERLEYVDLSYNEVSDWGFIDSLPEVFLGLRALRLSHNAIYEGAPQSAGITALSSIEEGYMITVGRLGKLTALNYSVITDDDRTNAEIYYLSRIGRALAEVAKSQEHTVTSQHRRYAELCEIYGSPTIARQEEGTINPDFLEARLIKFTFYLSFAGETTTKLQEIPKSFDIYRVKGIVGRMFDIPPLSMRLIWETGEWDPVAGYEEEEEDESDEDDEDEGNDKVAVPTKLTTKEDKKGKWMRREVELEDGTRQVGFCVDGMEAKVRLELR